MNPVYFLLGIHNHQPVGNFPHVLEKAYNEAYKPFLDVMSAHPGIKWSLHCTGILWDFFVKNHPEYVDTVRKMAAAGQVELLGGGYYEPILTTIPDRDKEGQIRKFNFFLQKEFSSTAKGMWLAERVWEPQLAKIMAESGMRYTVVDDAHFAAAGLDVEKLRGYYVTEEQGTTLSIFPISQRLRYYIPFQPVEKTIEYMASCAQEGGNPALVMADDGEKFGLWPETFKHVYQDKWLDNFLTAIEKNSQWIKTMTFSEYMNSFPPEGRVYLPAASYFEMSEWSLPNKAQEEFEGIVKQFESRPDVKRFLRGGFWRNFLTKYAESNNMHKKMLYVSGKIQRAREQESKKEKLSDSLNPSLSRSLDSIYAGQCNCAYWHGVFGGLYLPHLRSAIYEQLIAAELSCSGRAPKQKWQSLDFDCDGRKELIYESPVQNLYFAPDNGGSLFEWDFLPCKINILNVLTRREEAYHKRLREFLSNPGVENNGVKTIHDMVKVKEQNLDNYLHYDWYRRASCIDHFLHPQATFDNFRRCKYGEQGDFVLGSYAADINQKQLVLKRKGQVWVDSKSVSVEVSKAITPGQEGIKISYRVTNQWNDAVSLIFAPEFNYAFSCPAEGDNGILKDVELWSREDSNSNLLLSMKFDKPVELWLFPLETVSLSEGGFERTYQGTVALPIFPLELQPGKSADIVITIAVNKKT